MPLTKRVKTEALRQVQEFCERRVPPGLEDQVRLECSARGNSITIVERRPPWDSFLGSDWSSLKIAQFRYDPEADTWSLYCRDRNERWWPYHDVEPARDIGSLLAEIDADPTGIFWG